MLNKLLLLLAFVLFFLKGTFILDPDFGWHLRVGELTVTQGLPVTDPFSYTMPSYHFVNHEWFTDILLWKLYSVVGMQGLAVVYSLLAVLALYVVIQATPQKWSHIPLLLVSVSLFSYVGIRHQVIGWLFFAVLLMLLTQWQLYKRYFLVIPFLFLLWANMHGSFAIGIVTLSLYYATKIFSEKKLTLQDLLILAISCLATFVNPYGAALWDEVIKSLTDSSLRFTILEWMPMLFFLHYAAWLMVGLSSSLLTKFHARFSLFQKSLFIILLISAIMSARNYPLWSLCALPIATVAIDYLYHAASKILYGKKRFLIAHKFLWVLTIFAIGAYLYPSLNPQFFLAEREAYPEKAVRYLMQYAHPQRIYTTYGWGGYFIWNIPEAKYFVDGRMPSWRQNATSHESASAFHEYLDLDNRKKPFTSALTKYEIDTVVLPVKASPSKHVGNPEQESLLKKLFMKEPPKPSYPPLPEQLKHLGWKQVYKDDTAAVYQRN